MTPNRPPLVGTNRAVRPRDQVKPPQRILVVDDDLFSRHLIAEALIQKGYVVNGVADGVAGWEALNAHPYDLVITADWMPKMSGAELLERLLDTRLSLRVIMVTGAASATEFAHDSVLGPDATLVKPYTVELLVRTVLAVLPTPPDPRKQIAERANTLTPVLRGILQRHETHGVAGIPQVSRDFPS